MPYLISIIHAQRREATSGWGVSDFLSDLMLMPLNFHFLKSALNP